MARSHPKVRRKTAKADPTTKAAGESPKAASLPQSLLDMQHAVGNQEVVRLLSDQAAPGRSRSGNEGPSGQPLDPATRAQMEQHFGETFDDVRVHDHAKAAEQAQAAQADAFTVGRNIVFNQGKYRPGTAAGQQLLRHELTHVLQQRSAAAPAEKILGTPGSADEKQAAQAAGASGWGALQARYAEVAAAPTPSVGSAAPARISPVPPQARLQRVQLTYDDGPDTAGNTRNVLNSLNAVGARATFYLVGKRVIQGDNWRIVFDIAAAGHWIGNHAYDWNDATDNHIWLQGTAEERAQKILQTEWAIRDALIRGRDDAKKNNKWDSIPAANRDYIEDIIAHGTGRFRTPGFRSHFWKDTGSTTSAAIAEVNQVLAATGLRPLAITEVGTPSREGVDVDPEDWKRGRTQSQIESTVKKDLSKNTESILLHSRIAATAAATPAILADIQSRKFTFDPTPQGQLGSISPRAGFADLPKISDPPKPEEIAAARAFLKKHMESFGPVISGEMAVAIFQLAQRAGSAEVSAFAAEIKGTTIKTDSGPVPMANWLNASEKWRVFSGFFENWLTNKPFPRIKGVTL